MFNKISLTFKSANLEKEYIKSQSHLIRKEFTAFTYLSILYLASFIIHYFQLQQYYILMILSALIMACLIICLKYFIDRYPETVDYILPILQMCFMTLMSLTYIIRLDKHKRQEGDWHEVNYQWFYGFATIYIQFMLFIQGQLIIPQILVFVAFAIGYLVYFSTPTIEYASVVTSMSSILIGLSVIKYNFSYQKRLQFLNSRGKNQLLSIVENLFTKAVAIIKLDQTSSYLKLHQINHQSQGSLEIQTDYDLRKYLRNLRIISTKNLILENEIFRLLREFDSNAEIFTYMCNKGEFNYQIQVAKYWLEDQWMILLLSDKLKPKKQQIIDHKPILERLLYVSKQIIYKRINSRKELLSKLNFMHGVGLLLSIPKITPFYFKMENINLKSIAHYICDILKLKVTTKGKLNQEYCVSINIILQIIISLYDIMEIKCQNIQIKDQSNTILKMFQIKIELDNVFVTRTQKYNLDYECAFGLENNIDTFQKYYEVQRQGRKSILQAMSLTSCKYLLWRFANSQIVTLNINKFNQMSLKFNIMSINDQI